MTKKTSKDLEQIRQWVEKAKAGDREAFGSLVKKFERYVYSVAFSYTLNEDEALDLTQKIFLKAFTRLKDLREPSSFTSWLVLIAQNVCIDWARAQGRHGHHASTDDERIVIPERRRGPAQPAAYKKLLRLLADMPATYRTAFILHYLEGLPYKEIGKLLGVPFTTVVGRIHKAREFIRAHRDELGL